MTNFDHYDSYYLANTLTPQQLRNEIQESHRHIKAREFFDNCPCCILWESEHYSVNQIPIVIAHYEFDYEDYIRICREALTATPTAPRKPLPGKHIDIDSLKSRLDIVTEVERYTQLRKSGNNRFLGRCPLHEDRHPSMVVYANEQSWRCFQCNKGGDIIDFIMAVEGVDFRQAAAILGGT